MVLIPLLIVGKQAVLHIVQVLAAYYIEAAKGLAGDQSLPCVVDTEPARSKATLIQAATELVNQAEQIHQLDPFTLCLKGQ